MAAITFRELSVLTLHPEFAEEILLAHGARSVSFVDAADNPVLEPAPGATPLWPRTRTIGLFDKAQDLTAVMAALHGTLPDGKAAVVTSARLPDRDWVRIWLREWKPMRFGARLWVTPHARRRQIRGKDAVIVTLDPGLAFGTGTHPTTALCLDWLAGANLAGKNVLDYGCGSGLLAIAALKLGARRATAVDIDPQALLATRENARINRVNASLEVHEAATFKPARYDLVVANILSGPLVQLAPRICAALAPGGTLVLAGLLEHHAREVRAAYRPTVQWRPAVKREGWVRLEGRRAAPAVRAAGRSAGSKARPRSAASGRRRP